MKPDPGRATHDEKRPHHCARCAEVYAWVCRRILRRVNAL